MEEKPIEKKDTNDEIQKQLVSPKHRTAVGYAAAN